MLRYPSDFRLLEEQMVGALGYQGNGWAMGTGHANLYYPEGNWVSLDNAHRSILWMCDKSRSYWVGEVQKGSDCGK